MKLWITTGEARTMAARFNIALSPFEMIEWAKNHDIPRKNGKYHKPCLYASFIHAK